MYAGPGEALDYDGRSQCKAKHRASMPSKQPGSHPLRALAGVSCQGPKAALLPQVGRLCHGRIRRFMMHAESSCSKCCEVMLKLESTLLASLDEEKT